MGRKDIGRRKTVENMEGFHCSMQTTSIHEEWMHLAEIVNNDLENDLEKKRLSDFSGFDVVGLFNNNNSDKSFQRQQSYQDIFNEIEGEELMLGIDSAETAICINTSNNNNNNNNVVNTKARGERTGSLTGYSHYSPASPTDSYISTEDFPEELEELQPFEEMGDQLLQLGEQVAATFTLDVINNKTEEGSEEGMEEQESDSDEDYVPEYSKPVRRKSRAHQDTFKDHDAFEDAHNKDSSDSDPDFDPEDFEEVVRPGKKTQRSRKEATSDYESEELSEEEKPQKNLQGSSRRSRKPSRNPIPQQRKKGSTLKISQWIVELLRNPETNPSVIMWEDEPAGKFRVINSNAFAALWAKVKKNPAMNYEKLSRAMRYYYRNKEIEMVKGERLTYKFGPNMRDFRAKDRNDPNFQSRRK